MQEFSEVYILGLLLLVAPPLPICILSSNMLQ